MEYQGIQKLRQKTSKTMQWLLEVFWIIRNQSKVKRWRHSKIFLAFYRCEWLLQTHIWCRLLTFFFLMNYIIRLFYNFTVTVYCQHILNFGKEDRLSQYTEDFFPEYIECWKAPRSDGPVSCEEIPQWHFHFWCVISPRETLDLWRWSFRYDTSAGGGLAH